VALLLYIRRRKATREQTAQTIAGALMSAGVIILINVVYLALAIGACGVMDE
jgi:hypothetical protein